MKKSNCKEILDRVEKEFLKAYIEELMPKKSYSEEEAKGATTSAYEAPGYPYIPPIDWSATTFTTNSNYLAITLNTDTGNWNIPCGLERADMERLVEQLFEEFNVESVVKKDAEIPTKEEIEEEFIVDCLNLTAERENCGLDVVYMIADYYGGTDNLSYIGALSEVVYDYINENISILSAVCYILDAKEFLPDAED